MAILASPQNRLAATFGAAALLCHGALLMLERAPPQAPPQPYGPGTCPPSDGRLQPEGAERPNPNPCGKRCLRFWMPPDSKAAPAATRQTGERQPWLSAPPPPEPRRREAWRPALSDLLAAARSYSEAPEVRRLGPGTVLTPAEDAYLRGWRTRIERLGMVNFPRKRAALQSGPGARPPCACAPNSIATAA